MAIGIPNTWSTWTKATLGRCPDDDGVDERQAEPQPQVALFASPQQQWAQNWATCGDILDIEALKVRV
jgi:hypothetical protein